MSLLSIVDTPRVRNARNVNVSSYDPTENVDNTELLNAHYTDTGLDVVLANDEILITAMSDPNDFIKKRGILMKEIAKYAVEATAQIYTIIGQFGNNNHNLGELGPRVGTESILSDFCRDLAADITLGYIGRIDKVMKGVNGMVKEKILN